MGVSIKTVDQELTTELLDSMVGKLVYVPQNEHMAADEYSEELKAVNVWFAGTVAGYEISTVKYDYINDVFIDEPKITYNLLLTDGVGYILSTTKCAIEELTEEEFLKMVEEHQAKQKAVDSILLPGRDY